VQLLVTGCAGFIGSNFLHWLLPRERDLRVNHLDKLTYAGNPANLQGLDPKQHAFLKGDIANVQDVAKAMEGCEGILNFAAETHVDRSIVDPEAFLRTDVLGTHVLLEQARKRDIPLLQVSTDEVYGSIEQGSFTERSPLDPSSPYSASKASADLLCMAYGRTYGLDVRITRASNNFGPRQHPEKLIPTLITRALRDQPLPIYGDGLNVRDWLYAEDHGEAIWLVFRKGKAGEAYNVGAGQERANLDVARLVLAELGKPERLITFVKDRPGHDRRYSVDSTKVRALGWKPRREFEPALRETVRWYRENEAWWAPLLKTPGAGVK
jgi:dTDP-glucose 4,6-dehydratase